MKKILPISGFLLLLLVGIFGWQRVGYSQETEETEPATCEAAYTSAMEAVQEDWDANLRGLMDQEKATSDMTDEAFENMRTYNCWIRYVCEAVYYSGYAAPSTVQGTGITSAHIEPIPGCQDPEDLFFLDSWGAFTEGLDRFGERLELTPGGDQELIVQEKLNFIPQCMTNPVNNNQYPDLKKANLFYSDCLEAMDLKETQNMSILKRALKDNHARQKSSAFENKMHGIVTNMIIMQEEVEYMKRMIRSMEQRYPCAPGQCT